MTKIEVTRETRKQRRLELLGTATPRCGTCGFDRWPALELHHVAGRAQDPGFIVIVCRNCHRLLSNDQRDHPISPIATDRDNLLTTAGHLMLGMADLHRVSSEKLHEVGLALIERASTQTNEGPKCDQAKHTPNQ